jgi:hypothetical protein
VELARRQGGTGNNIIDARIDGKQVSQLTPLMSDRYSRLLTMITAAGETPVCEGIIRDTDNGLQLQLLLPPVT